MTFQLWHLAVAFLGGVYLGAFVVGILGSFPVRRGLPYGTKAID